MCGVISEYSGVRPVSTTLIIGHCRSNTADTPMMPSNKRPKAVMILPLKCAPLSSLARLVSFYEDDEEFRNRWIRRRVQDGLKVETASRKDGQGVSVIWTRRSFPGPPETVRTRFHSRT